MTIEVISSNTIKITLSELDMIEYDISYENLDRKNPETKRLLIELLQTIRLEKNIDLTSEKLFVEAFPQTNGGCLLYISLLNEKVRVKSENNVLYNCVVCEVLNIEQLSEMCYQLYNRYSHLIHNSELYTNNESYRLIIHTFSKLEDKLKSILNEYSIIKGKGEIICSTTREYYKVLIEEDAVEKIVDILC